MSVGDTILHYRLDERLGSGAMGEVYLAEDLRLHRKVALKMLPEDEAADTDAGARLLREARVASSLSHPNIAVVYEVGEVEREGRLRGFIAMEYVQGRTLADLLRDGPFEAPRIVPVARQIAEALLEAHERGIVHRDVKPGNVMVTERGLVKVLDFGVAKYAPPSGEGSATWSGRHAALEGGGAVLGTLAYMSPEQARGADVDARSDVFSLGAVLYELRSGRRPFQGRNVVELLEAVFRGEPEPLEGGSSPLDAGLADLVQRMLAKDRERRPSSMHDVLHALEALAEGRAPETAVAADDHAVAVMSFANVTGRPEDDWLGTGIAETVTVGLADVRGISVVSRERIAEVLRTLGATSATDDPVMSATLGREVAARGVISGSYQCQGDQVRVIARLTEVRTGKVALTVKVDGTRSSIFELQDRLVTELLGGLRQELPTATPRSEETQSLQAYEAYAKGLLNLREESAESLDRAILFFERAVAFDPSYARAHMYLGVALDTKGDFMGALELCARALATLDRALELRPNSAEAWRHKGSAYASLGRDREAIESYERALAANPTEAGAYSGLARVHFILRGDFARAVQSYEKALALYPQHGWAALQLAHCAAYLRDFPKAEAAARRAIALQQELLSGRTGGLVVGAFVRLGQVFALQDRNREALAEYERELEFLKGVDHVLRGRIFIELHQRMGEAHLGLGDTAAGRASLDLALEAFDRRLRNGADDPATRYYAACSHALRGEADLALQSLEKAAETRLALTVARARIEPALASLGQDPRFQALVARGPSPS